MTGKFNPPKKCLFCGGGRLSRTHIWPEWLHQLLDPQGSEHFYTRIMEDNHSRNESVFERTSKRKQGSMFSQKPFLACINCNTGWMKDFEDEMTKFALPMFIGDDEIEMTVYQTRVFAVWVSLITTLSQYIDQKRESVTITKGEREYVKRYRKPPDQWSIFAASQNVSPGPNSWYINSVAHTTGLLVHSVEERAVYRPAGRASKNTQISSFGMGKIFVQTFSCPFPLLVSDYRVAARSAGLVQIWPMRHGFWPFTKGLPKFPTKLVLDNKRATAMADAFHNRIGVLYDLGSQASPRIPASPGGW